MLDLYTAGIVFMSGLSVADIISLTEMQLAFLESECEME